MGKHTRDPEWEMLEVSHFGKLVSHRRKSSQLPTPLPVGLCCREVDHMSLFCCFRHRISLMLFSLAKPPPPGGWQKKLASHSETPVSPSGGGGLRAVITRSGTPQHASAPSQYWCLHWYSPQWRRVHEEINMSNSLESHSECSKYCLGFILFGGFEFAFNPQPLPPPVKRPPSANAGVAISFDFLSVVRPVCASWLQAK